MDVIQALDSDVETYALAMDVDFHELNEVLEERKPVSEGMAKKWAEATKTSPEVWINMQKSHDSHA